MKQLKKQFAEYELVCRLTANLRAYTALNEMRKCLWTNNVDIMDYLKLFV